MVLRRQVSGNKVEQCVRFLNLGLWTFRACYSAELDSENIVGELKFELISPAKELLLGKDIFGLSLALTLEMKQGITALKEDASLCEFPSISVKGKLTVSALPPLTWDLYGKKAGKFEHCPK